jgi:hypothetical protein
LNQLDHFRQLTNDLLKDLTVSQSLKEKTLERVARRSFRNFGFINKYSISASAAVIVLGFLLFQNFFLTNNSDLKPPQSVSGTAIEIYSSAEQNHVLLPSYIPENYAMQEYKLLPNDGSSLNGYTITFVSSKDYFTITQGKQQPPFKPEQFKRINLSGIQAYYQQMEEGLVELQWQTEDLYYRFIGTVSLQEAIKIASSIQ